MGLILHRTTSTAGRSINQKMERNRFLKIKILFPWRARIKIFRRDKTPRLLSIIYLFEARSKAQEFPKIQFHDQFRNQHQDLCREVAVDQMVKDEIYSNSLRNSSKPSSDLLKQTKNVQLWIDFTGKKTFVHRFCKKNIKCSKRTIKQGIYQTD